MSLYYDSAGITLYLGDCLEVMADLDVGYAGFELVFTSPPYNLGGPANKNLRSSRPRALSRWDAANLARGYGVHDDNLPWSEYVAWQRTVLSACWDLLAYDGAIFYNHKPVIRDKEVRLPTECNPDLPLRQIITWDRGSGFNFEASHYCPVYEWLLVLAKPDFRLRDRSASKATDLWRFNFEQDTAHPAPFPLALPARAIETTGAESVFDPFVGSGTSMLAAKLAGATGVGCDVEERFLEQAARRLDQGVLPLWQDSQVPA